VVFLPVETSRVVAIVAALTALFVLGYFKGKIVKMSPIRSALEILIIGGIATAVGLAAGKFFGV
ncbi:MAG: VIT1/CCC1 transporter family protein, partial [Patescibacteria group bacterium]